MNKTFKLDGRLVDVRFAINCDVEILQGLENGVFVEFESEQDDLEIDHSVNFLKIKNKEKFVKIKKIATAKIYVKDSDELNLKLNNGKVVSKIDIKRLNLDTNNSNCAIFGKIENCVFQTNNGIFNVFGEIEKLDAEGNNANFSLKTAPKFVNIDVNNANIELVASSYSERYEISGNKTNVSIVKNDFDGKIFSQEGVIFDGSVGENADKNDKIITIKTRGFVNLF